MQPSVKCNSTSFYRDKKIISFCGEMQAYNRNTDDAVDLMLTDPSLLKLTRRVTDFRALLAEYCFLVRTKYLNDEKKWNIQYMEEKITDNKHFYPTGLGKRIQIDDLHFKDGTECDSIFSFDQFDNYIFINETKSGKNSFSNTDIKKRGEIVHREFGVKPAVIAAVPNDNSKASEGSIEYFKSIGGNVLVFPENSEYLTNIAEQVLEKVNGWKKKF